MTTHTGLTASLLLILFVVSTQAPPPTGDWPQWMGPNRSNHSAEAGLLKVWPEGGPPLFWKAEGLGHGVASVAVSKGRVFTLGSRGEHECVTAVDEKSGKVLWSTPVGPDVKERSIMRYLAQRTPTIDGERVYAISASGVLVCLASSDGKERWRKDYFKDFGGKRHHWGFCDYPLVDGDRLICTPAGSDATIMALDKVSGVVLWKAAVPEGGANGFSALVAAEFGGIRQYINFLDSGLVSVAAADGKLLWRYEGNNSRIGNTHNLILLKDVLFCANGRSGCVLLRPRVEGTAFQVEQVYRVSENFQPWFGTAIRLGDHVFTFRDSGLLQCHELATGKLVWRHTPATRGPRPSRAVMTLADGHLYLRYADGRVALVEASVEQERLKSEFQGPSTKDEYAWPMPVVTGGRLYLRAQDRLFCYDVREPRLKTADPAAIFVPTPQDVVEKMLEMAKVQKSDRVYDLGCGDGRIVVTAAHKYGASSVGVDIDPECVRLSLENVKKHKVEHLVRIEQEDLFKTDLSNADVVALYLLPNMNEKLVPQLAKLKPGARVVAHHFPIPGVKPDKVVSVHSDEDGEEHSLYLWVSPLKKPIP